MIREHPEDLVAKNGRAEVLKSQGELSAALSAYEQVIREHPENVVAKTGRAGGVSAGRTVRGVIGLRAGDPRASGRRGGQEWPGGSAQVKGELAEALSAYEQVIREHPENAVAKNGRAEVLEAQGELAEALSAYEQVIREHPENAVAKNGRAEVLKVQGELAEALSAYEQVIREHPENVVAKTGRAEVLSGRANCPRRYRPTSR